MSRIIGVTVGTPTSPSAMEEKIKPVKSVNGNFPDESGNVEIDVPESDLTGYATEQYVKDYAQPKGNYLTEHQDISGKLDANKLPEAVNDALAQAKASGEFDGEDGTDGKDGSDGADGQRGTGILKTTTAPSSYTNAIGNYTPKYRIALSTLKSQGKVDTVLIGDIIQNSYYQYQIDYLDSSYAYISATRVSLRGATGAAGSDANVTAENIEAALGYTPANPANIPSEIHIGPDEPTDPAVKLWIDTDEDQEYVEIPKALPNPYPLTINGTRYDGSEAVEMTIVGGGGSAATPDWNAAEGKPGHILNRTHWVENEGKKTLFEATVTTSGNMAYIAMDGELKAGQTYTVTFQGTQFECVAKYGMFNGTLLCVYIGNPYPITGEYSTELFTILWVPHMGVTGVAVLLNDGSYPIKIEGDVITHHTISPKLLPKPIWLIDIDYDAETQSIDVSPIELNLALDSGELVALRAKRTINASLSIFHFTVRDQGGILEFDSPRSGSSVTYSRWLVPNASGGYDVTDTLP